MHPHHEYIHEEKNSINMRTAAQRGCLMQKPDLKRAEEEKGNIPRNKNSLTNKSNSVTLVCWNTVLETEMF